MSRKLQAPRIFVLKKIYIVNALVSILNGHTLFIGNSQKEARYLSSPVYCCPVYRQQTYKITGDILMTFAGGFFPEEIEDRVAFMFVVQIEVSFVSTRRESDKPEKINISVLSGCCL